MKKIFVITGATGNIGGRIAESLLRRNQIVRVTTRKAANAAGLAAQGAEVYEGDPADAAFLESVFEEAHAVFAMIPPFLTAPDYRAYQNQVGLAQAQAFVGAGVTRVVNLSSVGAHDGERSGVIKGLHDQEQRLNALEVVDVVHLRPAYFMENLFMGIEQAAQGSIGGALPGDLRMPMVATADIADAAVEILLSPFTSGKRVQYLLGRADVDMDQTAQLLEERLGFPVKYVRHAYEDVRMGLLAAGLSESGADLLIEMYRHIESGIVAPTLPRDAGSTTATSLKQFVEVLAGAIPVGSQG